MFVGRGNDNNQQYIFLIKNLRILLSVQISHREMKYALLI